MDLDQHRVYVYDFYDPSKSDSEIIKEALSFVSLFETRTLIFDQKDWYIDEAILLPSYTKVIIDGCMIKQNDEVFDNAFRGDNLTLDENEPFGDPTGIVPISHIEIEGRNGASIVGCDVNKKGYHPVMEEEQEMVGDYWGWRTLQICFSLAQHIEISGLNIKQTRCWAISFDKCAHFHVHDIHVESTVKNGDGVNARAGCHHFVIERITGHTSDDTVACTAMRPNGVTYPLNNYLFSMEPSRFLNATMDIRELDIHDGYIADICTGGFHHGVLCASGEGLRVYNIHIHRVHEPNTQDRRITDHMYAGYGTTHRIATIKVKQGLPRETYNNDNNLYNIRVNDVESNIAKNAILVEVKTDNVWLNNIIYTNADNQGIAIQSMDGVTVTNSRSS